MKARFAQLAIGQSFVHQGENFTKINSLLARNEGSNKQQLVPRSTMVEVAEPAPAAGGGVPTWDQVRDAFERYYVASVTCVEAVAGEDDQGAAEQAKETLAQARRRFLDTLPD